MTGAELQRLQDLAARARRRRSIPLTWPTRVRLAWSAWGILGRAWWSAWWPWSVMDRRQVTEARQVARRQLRAARRGRW